MSGILRNPVAVNISTLSAVNHAGGTIPSSVLEPNVLPLAPDPLRSFEQAEILPNCIPAPEFRAPAILIHENAERLCEEKSFPKPLEIVMPRRPGFMAFLPKGENPELHLSEEQSVILAYMSEGKHMDAYYIMSLIRQEHQDRPDLHSYKLSDWVNVIIAEGIAMLEEKQPLGAVLSASGEMDTLSKHAVFMISREIKTFLKTVVANEEALANGIDPENTPAAQLSTELESFRTLTNEPGVPQRGNFPWWFQLADITVFNLRLPVLALKRAYPDLYWAIAKEHTQKKYPADAMPPHLQARLFEAYRIMAREWPYLYDMSNQYAFM